MLLKQLRALIVPLVKCPACKGAKRTLSMGMIKYDDCKQCNGFGSIVDTEAVPKIEEVAVEAVEKPAKKKKVSSTRKKAKNAKFLSVYDEK